MCGVRAAVWSAWCVLAAAQVAGWTVDLEEVRQYLDRHRDDNEEYHQLHYYNHYDESDEFDGFSEAGGPAGQQYAQQYGYEGYMEKKVHGFVFKGAKYLEGLRLALENYQQLLENCSVYNFTEFSNLNATVLPVVKWDETPDVWNTSWVRGLDRNLQWPQMFNITKAMLGLNSSALGGPARRPVASNRTQAEAHRAKCLKATREREHVRRLADLALFIARQLQNWAMSEKLYVKSEVHAKEERALITRLAFFLDQLAELTGYKPDFRAVSTQTERAATSTAVPATPASFALPEDVKRVLVNCLSQHAAAQRCRPPLKLPPLLMMMLNISDDSNTTDVVFTAPTSRPVPRGRALTTPVPPPAGSRQLLPADLETRQSKVVGSRLVSNVWSRRPQATGPVKSKRKRSVNDPLSTFVDQFKRLGLNPSRAVDRESIEHLLRAEARRVYQQVSAQNTGVDTADSGPNKQVNPRTKPAFLELGDYRRLNTETFVPKKTKDDDKMSEYLKKLRSRRPGSVKHVQKRSVRVQEPEDPGRDISLYVKTKPGTNVRPSAAGAVAARAGLERVFNTGNIEVVRRYGANYNPLVPSPFYFGIAKTISDI